MAPYVPGFINRQNTVQMVAYLIGGTTYFWVGYLVFALCYSGLKWDWLWAKILADIFGWTANYFIQRYWAFDNPLLKRHEAQTAGKYAALTIFNLGLDYLIIWGLKSIGISPYMGFFISAGFFTIWNYVLYKFWVFLVDAGPKQSKRGA